MSRRINELETKLHQAALSASRHEITSRQAEAVIPDQKARQNALNFLLGVGLFKSLKDAKGNVIFRAVTKGELEQTKDLSGEESLVLGHIKSTTNEGIWTKHLKTKTNLHQTIIDRCLKTLTQKKLIKRVPSVQHPTRKIYMLEHLEPSVGLTGGPWYTENELDTAFIETISSACLKFIRDVSFPKQRKEAKEGALFPISNAPRYPTAAQVHNTLRQARLTETELAVEHFLDGEVEKLPAFGTQLWDSNAIEDGDSADEHDGPSKKKKKRRRSSSSDEDEAEVKTKRKKKRVDADSDDEEEDSSRKKSKLKRRKGDDSDDSGSDAPKKKKKKKRNDSDESDSDDASSRKKKKKKKKNESNEESDSDDGARGKRKRRKRKTTRTTRVTPTPRVARRRRRKSRRRAAIPSRTDDRGRRTKSVKRSPSPFNMFDSEYSGGVVYRAVNQEKITLGWSEAPCSKCPSFEFCKEGGPVNAKECVYYEDWLVAGTVAFDDES
ncbi:RNA polymerase Rpc34 subunit-domain-containing protein [Mycena metata]|uniref:RNA polymerase Rpc34 subunit-domain-containing protein n=1 Tax=Mycena metata TaxID=1033252 RepID=A0AAD7KA63_9AGAR|nr:RNA polymerase Rpc34 subunit-domain-containing protein [Mycena metata]